MVLERIRVKGFQCLGDYALDLDPLLTVIIGPNDAGKSALLRSLKWVCTNQYAGPADGLVSWNKAVAKVTLKVDGHTVVRRKGKAANSYTLDGQLFKAFGAGKVPDPVARLLNVGEVNFQDQLAGPFWFHLTPGQVGKELNKVVNLEVIDTTLYNAAAGVRKLRAEADVSRARLTEARAARKQLAYVPALVQVFSKLEAKYNKVATLREKRLRLAELVQDGAKAALSAHNAAQANVACANAMAAGDALVKKRGRIASLRAILLAITNLRGKLCQATTRAAAVKRALSKVSQCPLCGAPLPASAC